MPFVQSSDPFMGRALQSALLEALMTRPGAELLVTPTCHLFTAGPGQILPTTTVAEFTEATFAGYAEQVLTGLDEVVNLPSGDGLGVHGEANFTAGAVTPPGEVILGYWVDDGAAAFYLGEYFDSPVGIANLGDFISLDVVFGLQNPTQIS